MIQTTNIVQFNARVPERLRQKIKQDAARTGETIDTIATAILQFFFKEVPLARRREMYAAVSARAKKSLWAAKAAAVAPQPDGAAEPAPDLISQRGGKDAGQIPAATAVQNAQLD